MAFIAGTTAAGVGGGIGLLVGVAGAGERWRPVPVGRESGRSPSAPGVALEMCVTY